MALLYPVGDPQDPRTTAAATDLPPSTDEHKELLREAALHPFWTLSDRQICDIELLLNGGFAPLSNFMRRADYESVLKTMRLTDGSLYPIPVTLDVSQKFIAPLSEGDVITLRNHESFAIATMTLSEIWEPDRTREMELVYATQDRAHPAVAYLSGVSNPIYVAGQLQSIDPTLHTDYRRYRHTPRQLRAEFERRNWKKVVAFQTRNPMHRAHIALTEKAMRDHDAKLLLHPVVGMTKPGDVDHYTRVRCYQHVLGHYPQDSVMLSLLPLAMRMGGPREALWHGIIRKNFGCTHIIVGRDHAGPGRDSLGKPFYGEFEAQRALVKHAPEIGIEAVPFDHMIYQPAKKKYVFMSEIEPGEKTLSISGTALREILVRGEAIPEWFTLPQIAAELHRTYPPLKQRGFTVFFTGLSGSGKSTLAKALEIKLCEHGRSNITLLDGDVVRTHLSSELTFSHEHRSINVRRIGYVASEITKNGGIAICAPIAPYENDRKANRELISGCGGYLEVYLSTPLEVCEKRDTKGFYLRARENLTHNFTGITDPYETPVNPEIVVDTTDLSVNEAVDRIYAKLESLGYL